MEMRGSRVRVLVEGEGAGVSQADAGAVLVYHVDHRRRAAAVGAAALGDGLAKLNLEGLVSFNDSGRRKEDFGV